MPDQTAATGSGVGSFRQPSVWYLVRATRMASKQPTRDGEWHVAAAAAAAAALTPAPRAQLGQPVRGGHIFHARRVCIFHPQSAYEDRECFLLLVFPLVPSSLLAWPKAAGGAGSAA
jgi:hypothetical protein